MSVGTLLRNPFTFSTIESHFGGTSEKELPYIFKTSKGSMYFGDAKGKTLRFKTPHIGHNPSDVGWKKPSDQTIYVNTKDAMEIAKGINYFNRWLVFTTNDSEEKRLVYIELINGQPKKIRNIEYTTIPAIGLSPIEMSDGVNAYVPSFITFPNKLHVGNEITEIY